MNSHPLNSHPEILLRVSQGDEQAFEKLVYQYSEKVFFHALTFVKTWEQAEETVQDIFLKIWEKRKILAEVENFDNYLFIVSKNFLISAIRKKLVQSVPLESAEYESLFLRPDDQFENKELGVLLERAIEELPETKGRCSG